MSDLKPEKERDWIDKQLDDLEFRKHFLNELERQHAHSLCFVVTEAIERCAAIVEADSCGGSCDHSIHRKQWQLAADIRRTIPKSNTAEEDE